MLEIFTQNPWETILVLSMVPFFGIPLTVPLGILLLGLGELIPVSLAALGINLVLSVFLFFAGDYIIYIGKTIPLAQRPIRIWETWVHKKSQIYVQKYGIWSLTCLLALPLPHTGAYAGSVFGKILGYNFKDYIVGSCIGLFACSAFTVIITTLVYTTITTIV